MSDSIRRALHVVLARFNVVGTDSESDSNQQQQQQQQSEGNHESSSSSGGGNDVVTGTTTTNTKNEPSKSSLSSSTTTTSLGDNFESSTLPTTTTSSTIDEDVSGGGTNTSTNQTAITSLQDGNDAHSQAATATATTTTTTASQSQPQIIATTTTTTTTTNNGGVLPPPPQPPPPQPTRSSHGFGFTMSVRFNFGPTPQNNHDELNNGERIEQQQLQQQGVQVEVRQQQQQGQQQITTTTTTEAENGQQVSQQTQQQQQPQGHQQPHIHRHHFHHHHVPYHHHVHRNHHHHHHHHLPASAPAPAPVPNHLAPNLPNSPNQQNQNQQQQQPNNNNQHPRIGVEVGMVVPNGQQLPPPLVLTMEEAVQAAMLVGDDGEPFIARARQRIYSMLLVRAMMIYFFSVPTILRRLFEYFILFCALFSFAMWIYLHVIFVKQPLTCLDRVNNSWPRNGILRVQIGAQHSVELSTISTTKSDMSYYLLLSTATAATNSTLSLSSPLSSVSSSLLNENIISDKNNMKSNRIDLLNYNTRQLLAQINTRNLTREEELIQTWQRPLDYFHYQMFHKWEKDHFIRQLYAEESPFMRTLEVNEKVLSKNGGGSGANGVNTAGTLTLGGGDGVGVGSGGSDTNMADASLEQLLAVFRAMDPPDSVKPLDLYPFSKRKVGYADVSMVEYSLEYGLLRLTEEMRSHYHVPVMTVTLCPDTDPCFRGSLARFMLRHFLGFDDVLIGSVKRLAEFENNRGYVRNVITGEHFRFVNVWMTRTSYLAAGFIMIMFTLFVSMLIRYSHQQVFIFVSEFLATFEQQLPISRITNLAASMVTIVLALIGIEAIMYEFFADSTTAFHVIIMVWLADQFVSMAIRSPTSKRYFLRFFYLYQFTFYAYHYRFNGQYSGLALLTTMLFTYHAMIFFFHHYEWPLLQRSLELRNNALRVQEYAQAQMREMMMRAERNVRAQQRQQREEQQQQQQQQLQPQSSTTTTTTTLTASQQQQQTPTDSSTNNSSSSDSQEPQLNSDNNSQQPMSSDTTTAIVTEQEQTNGDGQLQSTLATLPTTTTTTTPTTYAASTDILNNIPKGVDNVVDELEDHHLHHHGDENNKKEEKEAKEEGRKIDDNNEPPTSLSLSSSTSSSVEVIDSDESTSTTTTTTVPKT